MAGIRNMMVRKLSLETPPGQYRIPMTLDATCLLDVLAAAGAAKLSEARFSFAVGKEGQDTFPDLNDDLALECLAALSSADSVEPRLSLGLLDLLRATGQLPTLGARVEALSTRVSVADIVAWRESRAAKLVSLRLETDHISDVPAAQRAQGSAPIERYSHPGRNALASFALLGNFPEMFMLRDVDGEYVPSTMPYALPPYAFMTPRAWAAPLVPVSWETWWSAQSVFRPINGIAWFLAAPKNNGKFCALSTARRMYIDSTNSYFPFGERLTQWL